MPALTPYDIIRQSLVDAQLVEALSKDISATLSQHCGITDPNQIKEFAQIFELLVSGASQQGKLGQKLEEQFFGTLEVATEMKEGLKRTIAQIDQAYRSTMLMYQISFYLGVLLILVAVGTALLGKESLLSSIFGTLGTADVIAFFLLKPQERLQASRASLAQVQAALYNWFIDSVNLNTLMNGFAKKEDFANAAVMSESLMLHTDKTLEMLQKYCKFTNG